VILSPLFICIALFIKCVSPGPVLYRQLRYGLNGRPFKVWKFRTIEVSREPDDHHSHVADLMASNRPLEKRDHKLDVIRAGALFRSLGIDELPQLINVLKGEMSLVGPRPDVVPFHQYEGWHRRRFEVLPGITGLWQVCGKNERTFVEMMCLDVAYVRRRSIWLDVRILLLTLPALTTN
jgi:lipopolysaccharide/colanic/teichoic acid biosynthesis glycosyltransferase